MPFCLGLFLHVCLRLFLHDCSNGKGAKKLEFLENFFFFLHMEVLERENMMIDCWDVVR